VKTIPEHKYLFSNNVDLIISTEPKALVMVERGNNVVCTGNANEAGFYECNISLIVGRNTFTIKAIDPTGDKNKTNITLYKDDAEIFIPIPSEFLGDILIVQDGKVIKTKGEVSYFGFYVKNDEVKVNVFADNKLVCSNYQTPYCEKRKDGYFISYSLGSIARKYNAKKVTIEFNYNGDIQNVTIDLQDQSASVGGYSIILGGALLPFYSSNPSNSLFVFGLGTLLVIATAYYDLRGQSIDLSRFFKKFAELKGKIKKKEENNEEKPKISLKERIANFFKRLREELKKGD